MAKRIKIGDVVEITTPRGVGFAHYTHKHAMYGSVLRVLPGLHDDAPADLARLVAQRPQFIALFALQAAVGQGLVDIVGNVVVPADAKQFPLFRAPMRTPGGGVSAWWLWNGVQEWRVGELDEGQRLLPLREIVSLPLLVDRILAGWTPEQEAA
jgi:hypothetical protein